MDGKIYDQFNSEILKSKVSLSGCAVCLEGGVGFKGGYNTANNVLNLGISGELGAFLGAGLDVEFSIDFGKAQENIEKAVDSITK